MDVKWLEDFISLQRLGNFSAAARARNVTQPAFSRRIRALEMWLGVPLFDRSSNPILLTPYGERFLPLRRGYSGADPRCQTGLCPAGDPV
ncbi:LysR family transcriptional regulator [Edwardsiella ictaluri]|uniref:LysR family transcriptional regulator n=1 Tax=Edwardsiella ictaluri TaxID=67780 RepID=A0ABY8GEL2_EDWIC|nr:LysR family transcriptional regulator [Edwardsiella ictaluri]WFN95937.1 LysR family transcriptional regulator [Edwardsiella ictaluri]WFO10154.1 LysR family transcriptional regulator [Edwardsiella ictaluri]